MRRHICTLGALAIVLGLGVGCDNKEDGAADPAAAAAAPKAGPSAEPAAKESEAKRLLGSWVKVEEFGGGECKDLDCSAPLPAERQTKLEFEPKTYSKKPSVGPPQAGGWTMTEASGDSLKVELTVDGLNFPPSKQSVVFLDADRFEMRADNRHGGIYKRASG